MLILSRKVDERIVIGDDIVLTFTKINGSRVVVGIEAPREISIRRGELEANADRDVKRSPVVLTVPAVGPVSGSRARFE